MRMSSFLLLALSLHVSAKCLPQKVSITVKQAPLSKVFDEISKQTGMSVFYKEDLIRTFPLVTISVKDATVSEVLDKSLRGLPLVYEIAGAVVKVKSRKTPSLTIIFTDIDTTGREIRGRVVDSIGAPLVGATVRIKGTNKGANTNIKGEFELHIVKNGEVLIFSYTGYVTREIIVSGNPSMYVTMQHSQDILDATVIQAYGTTSRRFNVGSIATVDAATIEKQPVFNPLLALEGQVPGLAVNATSGVPGANVQLQVRGQNTLGTAASTFSRPYDQPLFIIDGIPFAPQNSNVSQLSNLALQQSTSGGISQAGGISPFATINPLDIESITILKDADATSIYGTQGSNGVILITTKKGKPGKTAVNIMATTGFNSAARNIQLLNTQQYLALRKETYAQSNLTPGSNPLSSSTYAPDLTIFDQNKYTNWDKQLYGKTTNNTDVHVGVSGGVNNNTFLLSGGYTRSDFNYPGNFSDQRLTLHSTTHHGSGDNRLSIDFGVDFGYDQNYSASFGGGKDLLNAPNLPDLTDSKGNLFWSYQGVSLQNYQIYAFLRQPVKLQTYNMSSNLHMSYKILPGLSLGVTAGYGRNTSNENSSRPGTSQNPTFIYRSAEFATNNFQTVDIEPQIDYNVNLGRGAFSALVGATYKKNTNYSSTIEGDGYTNDQFLGSIDGAATTYPYDNSTLYKYDAGFARLKYVYDQKYILSLTGRRDGSSNFGPGRQFGSFGSVGAGWIFTQEKAMRDKLPVLSYGKLSGSYGTSGSDGIAGYMYQPFWQPVQSVPAIQGTSPDMPTNLYNPDYSWATKRSLNLSLDLGFFHDRLLANATFYRDRESNQLGGYPLPGITGFSQVLGNLLASVQNQGWEFSFTSSNIKSKDFTWTSTFNITFNHNKLLNYPNLTSSPYASTYVIGQPTSIQFGYKYKDINPTTGLFEFYDAKGNITTTPHYGTIAQGGDQVPISNREVKYMGGFGNTFTYKRISLMLFFQFSSQTAPTWLNKLYSGYYPGFMFNQPTAVLGHYWTGAGDSHATLQRLMSSYSSTGLTQAADFASSSGAYGDDTYLRLKTVSLSYALPDDLLKHLHIHDLRFYCNVQNLLTFTNYKVADPETFSDYTTFPIQRIVAFGLNCNF